MPKHERFLRGRVWTLEEEKLVMEGRDDLPGRTKRQCQQKRVAIRRRKKSRREWSPDEIADLLAGKRQFEGRTPIAVQRKFEDECGKLKRQGKPVPRWESAPWTHYQPHEVEAIRRGETIPGRSKAAIQKKRLRLDPMRIWTPRPRWTPEQTERLLQNPRAEIAGRSLLARRHRLWNLGLKYRLDFPLIVLRPPKIERPSGSVLVTASDQGEGYALLQAISRALPSNLPDQVKAEAIGEAAIIHLEQGISPEAAAKEALRRARAFNNISHRFGEYNNALHDRGLWD